MKVKYEAKIFDKREKGRSAWAEFWLGDSIIVPPRYRIDLFKQDKDGYWNEVDYEHVRFKRNIQKTIDKMLEKQRRKGLTGQIGSYKTEIEPYENRI